MITFVVPITLPKSMQRIAVKPERTRAHLQTHSNALCIANTCTHKNEKRISRKIIFEKKEAAKMKNNVEWIFISPFSKKKKK